MAEGTLGVHWLSEFFVQFFMTCDAIAVHRRFVPSYLHIKRCRSGIVRVAIDADLRFFAGPVLSVALVAMGPLVFIYPCV